MTTAVVVGSGPNGPATAIELTRNGVDVHVVEAAGVIHDDGSAVHPTALASPLLGDLDGEFNPAAHGLQWCWPQIDLIHPLHDGTAGVLRADLDRTRAALGVDATRWRPIFGRAARNFDDLVTDTFRPLSTSGRQPECPATMPLDRHCAQ